MKFRPCIDIHNGQVKQIVGATLNDGDAGGMVTNFETLQSPAWYASLYRSDNLYGGHVIMLGPGNAEAAFKALEAFPGGMQVGGGITPENAGLFLDKGASHIIATSYIFNGAFVNWDRLAKISSAVGTQRLVLDVSCKKQGSDYMIAANRWQTVTSEILSAPLMEKFAPYCDEFLVHAADVEGLQKGPDSTLVRLLADICPKPVTYAGGIRTLADMDAVRGAGKDMVDASIGSALDIFGGALAYADVVAWHQRASCTAKR